MSCTFNRILRLFRDDLPRDDFRAKNEALADLSARYAARGLPLRHDFARGWENAHVLLELERLAAERRIERVLDLGGGNSPVSYYLAEKGFHVVVLDTDHSVVEALRKNSRELMYGERLTAVHPEGKRWPFRENAFDCILSISVFEGVLRKDRPQFWAEIRRVLRPGGSLLMTFDFGPDARYVGDPPTSVAEVMSQIVEASGLELVGEPPAEPAFDPELGPPVKAIVPTIDGLDYRAIAYSFGAVHLRRPS